MLRTRRFLAVTAAAAFIAGGTASAVEPVDTVVRTVEEATGVRAPGVGGPAVIDVPGGGRVHGRSAVVGLITIQFQSNVDAPNYVLAGALSDPNQWSCTGAGSAATYTVTCLPVALVLPTTYHCDVLHADAFTFSDTGSARTTLDCDSDGVAEAQTDLVTGPNGNDFVWAVDTRPVTAFTCTVDNGSPDYTGRCGDPGLVGVE